MSIALAIKPSAGILRNVINGDNALSPSSVSNVTFDGFGGKVHGVSQSAIVNWTGYSGPTTFNPYNPQAVTAYYYWIQINFSSTISYVPFFSHQVQGPGGGAWLSDYVENHVTYYSSGGILLPQGSVAETGAFATSTSLLLYYKVINFVSPISVSQPSAFSYRLFGV